MSSVAKLLALGGAVLLLQGCLCPLPELRPDFTSPEKTLLTFHEAFKRDEIAVEYECFSLSFKKVQGNLNLTSYYDLRTRLVEENPVASLLFSLQDLEDNIVRSDRSEDGELASLTLSLGGEDVTVEFIRETIYRLEFEKGGPFEDFSDSIEDLIRVEKNLLGSFSPYRDVLKEGF